MRIGIDMDSVMNDLDERWAAWVQLFDPAFTVQSIKTWDTHKWTTIGHNVYNFLKIPGVFRTLPVRPGAQAVVERLVNKGHDVMVITSAIPESWVDKVAWVREHFPFIRKDNLILSSRKGLMKLDVLFDDGLHNFKDFTGRGILYDRPWNRVPEADHRSYFLRLERAYDWSHFEELLMPAQFRRCDPELGCGPDDREIIIRNEADRLANTPS